MCRLVARSIEKQVVSKDHPSFTDDNDQAATFFNEMSYAESGNSWSLIASCRKAIEKLEEMKNLPLLTVSYQVTGHHKNLNIELFYILLTIHVCF
jgi:hypothetical protein